MATPFTVDVPQTKIDAIRSKLERASLTYAPVDDANWRYGADLGYMAEFIRYWLEEYDWREAERMLNAFPQYKADIEGYEVHFYHVPAKGGKGHPVILTHGWPGSVVEFLNVIDRLTDPERYGGDPDAALTLVIPSLPGFGFSGRPARPIGPRRIAGLWRGLMVDELGYRKFGAQGGDWGAGISLTLAREYPDLVSSVHVNLIYALPTDGDDPDLQDWANRKAAVVATEGAYMLQQATKPQTLAIAMSDTPAGFAAWVLEKCRTWSDCGGDLNRAFTREALITNIMTYLVNDAVTSAFWLYHGSSTETPSTGPVTVPCGFACFPAEYLPAPPRRAVEKHMKIVRWTEMAEGGHFAAWEQPALFADEISTFFTAHR